jgi:hypothetical protein
VTNKRFISLTGLVLIQELVREIPDTKASLSITRNPLHEAYWISSTPSKSGEREAKERYYLDSYAGKFACLAMLESGECNIDPQCLGRVIGITSGSSIVLASSLIQDPSEELQQLIKVPGNTGRAGISLFVSVDALRIRSLNPENWMINFSPYNPMVKNEFEQTSIHLAPTGYEFPFDVMNHAIQGFEVFFLETVILVVGTSRWVADLDIVNSLTSSEFLKHLKPESLPPCEHIESPNLREVCVDQKLGRVA